MKGNKQIAYIGIGAVALIAVLLIGRNLFGDTAKQAMLQDAFTKLLEAETYHVKTDLDLKLALTPEEDKTKSFNNATIRLEGDVQYNDESVPELAGNLYMDAKGRGNILFVDGEARILSDTVAFRLDNMPTLVKNSGALVEKWTYVDSSLLQTKNKEAVFEAFRIVMQDVEYQGKEQLEGEDAYHFTGRVSDEQKKRLIAVTKKEASGNAALHIITRLLRHNNVRSFDIWLDESSKELTLVRVNFVRPLKDGEADFATLNMSFTDYDKKVTIDRPEKELTVKPEVFGRFFGEGRSELQAATAEE